MGKILQKLERLKIPYITWFHPYIYTYIYIYTQNLEEKNIFSTLNLQAATQKWTRGREMNFGLKKLKNS